MVLSQTLAVLWSPSEVTMTEAKSDSSRSADATASATQAPADGTPGVVVDGLLAQVARGNMDAFAVVCDQVAGPVYGLVHRIVGEQARSGQVTEQVLLEVWRTASRFDFSAGSGLAWIIAIAQRCAVRDARRAASRGEAAGSGSSGMFEKMGERTGLGPLTHPGLALLPAGQREAILLACCGYTWQEVADLARVPAGTVAAQLHDGLLKLSSQRVPASS